MVAMSDMQVGYLNDLSILDGLELAGESHPLCGLSGNVKEINSRVPLELLEEGVFHVVVHLRAKYTKAMLLADLRSNIDSRVQSIIPEVEDALSQSSESEWHAFMGSKAKPPSPFDYLFNSEG